MGSERSFRLVFAVVFTIVGLFPLLGDGGPRWWARAVAAVFLALVFVATGEVVPVLWTAWRLS